MNFSPLIVLALLQFDLGSSGFVSHSTPFCTDDQLRRCADNAEPIFRNSEFAVPDSPQALNTVCSTWSGFLGCVRNFTKQCMTAFQRLEFDRAVREPFSAMDGMCNNPEQREEYLQHAPCVKKISVQDNFCGKQHKFLLDLISEGNVKQVCCARAKFLNCIRLKTPLGCENRKGNTNSTGRNSTMLGMAILDSSLTFVSQKCESASFEESDCPGVEGNRPNSKGPLNSPAPGKVRPTGGKNKVGLGPDFQLDQGRPGGSKGQPPVQKPSTTTKEIKEKPVTGQLAGTIGSQSRERPQTKPASQGKASYLKHNNFLFFTCIITVGFMKKVC